MSLVMRILNYVVHEVGFQMHIHLREDTKENSFIKHVIIAWFLYLRSSTLYLFIHRQNLADYSSISL